MEHDRETRIRQRAYQIWQDEGSPDGRQEDHWAKAAREIDSGDIEGGGVTNPGVVREAIREHMDAFVVASDLEDADQRESSPGTREQP
ncbi:DUF2934 domain-containing protein [Pararhizobium sp. PWRC1-1]|uniref:DUF2934 domain-containing protein n=1 Tax=Pararhizobium sp. PWRC1-1 TaxID=2804566 RepID=UPI003CFA7521